VIGFPKRSSSLPAKANSELSRRRALLSALTIWPALRTLRAQKQTAQAKPDFSTDVKVVNVFATVRDKDGKIVRDLTKADFTLLEDGRPQNIQYFSQQSDLPLTLGLLVDTSRSEQRMLGSEKEASRTFLEKVLREDRDHAFLIHFDREIELLQDLTSSRAKLERALDELNMSEENMGRQGRGGQRGGWGGPGGGGGWGGRGGGGQGPGGGRRGFGGGTAFYDAVYLAANDVLKSQSGRKAVIMLTDGEDNASKISLSEAISTAQHSDTLAYSIRIADEENASFGPGGFGGFPGGRGGMGGGRGRGRGPSVQRVGGKKVLREISDKTGGSYHEYSKKRPLDQIYAEIEEELRNQYSIGYTPDRPPTEAGFRKITLTVRDNKLQVRAREGYYAGNSA
jgi:VWFA-related protein